MFCVKQYRNLNERENGMRKNFVFDVYRLQLEKGMQKFYGI